MPEIIKDFWSGMPIGMYIILILVFGLLVASWAVPPLGAISSSALQGSALVLAATWLFYVTCHIPTILASGAKIRASYGNAQIEIGRKKNDDEIQSPEKQPEEKETEEENEQQN